MAARDRPYDLLIIGGGVNGTAIARAAAVAGWHVLLVEQGDLAGATSSASTKLMHGGLRYLEQREFRLVRDALAERAIMLRTAPHIVRPLEFRLPHVRSMRPWWMLRIGLWLYDLLALGGGLPRSRAIRIDDPLLRDRGGRGFSYWDGRVDDARLVVLNARDAADAGADIRTRTRFVRAERAGDHWRAMLRDGETGAETEVTARAIVNAAGPWVDRVLAEGLGMATTAKIRLVRGSHLVVRRAPQADNGWLLQQPDGRIIFIIPYLDDHLMIGTTEVTVDRAEDAEASAAEIDYLIEAANRSLAIPLTHAEIVRSFAGIRPLFDDGTAAASAVSRDYRLVLDAVGPPLLSIFGGKITIARRLADDALERLGITTGLTADRPLPGGDFTDLSALLASARARWPFLSDRDALRLVRTYGTRIATVLGEARTDADLGVDFGGGLRAREVDYLIQQEWARTAEDILWRRTKLGYALTREQVEALAAYVGQPPGHGNLQ